MTRTKNERRKQRLQGDLRRERFLDAGGPPRVPQKPFQPQLEALEARQLMAADLAVDTSAPIAVVTMLNDVTALMSSAPRHNAIDPEDVDDDGECTPSDALAVINAVNSGTNDTTRFIDVNGDGLYTAVDVLQIVNRLNSGNWRPNPKPTTPAPTTSEIRSIDGTGNNLTNTTWGSAKVDLLRTAAAEYGDGISSLAGADRPSPRVISNAISDQTGFEELNSRNLAAMAYAWGQFIDHDLDLTPTGGTELLKISVPEGDPIKIIPTTRSIYDAATGTSAANPRQQVNTITAFLDGSMVYGSDATTANLLRTGSGGLMKTSAGNLLPLNDDGSGNTLLTMANDSGLVPNNELFIAGDVRANENIELTSLHTLFVREHNYWAGKIAAANPTLTDEQIYQQARAIVIGEIQAITYNQWLPAIMGDRAIDPYRGYNAAVNPGISNEFSTAGFRFGHSLLGDDVEFLDNDGEEVADEIPLSEAFFNPGILKELAAEDGPNIDPLLKYLASDVAQELDTRVVDSVRNFLFGPPGSFGLDLASLNIMRGRDHGVADYNAVRVAYHLPAVISFSQITSDATLAAKLQTLYGSVDNIDLWVGALAEDHVRGSSVGPTLQAIISDQFERVRDGDRLWYERTFSGSQLRQIQQTTLADVIQRNTEITGLQNNVFFFRAAAEGQVFSDLNGDGKQNNRNEQGLAGIQVQLLDVDGNVLDTTTTLRDGRYRFDSFTSPGDYQVQIVLPTGATLTTASSLKLHISTGDQVIRGLSFGVLVSKKPTTPTKPALLIAAMSDPDWRIAVDQVFGQG